MSALIQEQYALKYEHIFITKMIVLSFYNEAKTPKGNEYNWPADKADQI